jgi:geranylgeranyl pyrophosphate synthase
LFHEKECEALAGSVIQAGGVGQAREIAGRYAQKARKILNALYDGPKRGKLDGILDNTLAAAGRF